MASVFICCILFSIEFSISEYATTKAIRSQKRNFDSNNLPALSVFWGAKMNYTIFVKTNRLFKPS